MICILHGYLLEGSGSNLWTRAIIRSLCRQGETVHLFCQENHPELYDFISEAYRYDENLHKTVLFRRQSPYSGRCIIHKPWIGKTLPVYVWDKYEEYDDVRPMTDLSDAEIEAYLERNIAALKKVIAENNIGVLHANHAVLMSVVAQRIHNDSGIPYAVMPHGSAIEYAVKKDERIFKLAQEAFRQADRLFVIGQEIRQRVIKLFPAFSGLQNKMVELNLGVDTALFKPIEPQQRSENIERLCRQIQGTRRGRAKSQTDTFLNRLSADISVAELRETIKEASDYNGKLTDEDTEEKLLAVDWKREKILLFVGRIISGKGLHSIISALPLILRNHPGTRLVIVGHGPLREPLEALLWALRNNARALVSSVIEQGKMLEGSEAGGGLDESRAFMQRLKGENKLDDYFDAASRYLKEDSVIFTGYLTHNELQYLFPASDAAVFPSVVAEAGPLVFLEAMASGCFPVGTYFAGMAASIDSTQGYIPSAIQDLMKIHPQPENTVRDIADNVAEVLKLNRQYASSLRKLAEEKYDWSSISQRFKAELMNM